MHNPLDHLAARIVIFVNYVQFDDQPIPGLSVFQISLQKELRKIYHQTSNISRTKSHNLNVYCLILQLSLPNPLKPGVK